MPAAVTDAVADGAEDALRQFAPYVWRPHTVR